MNTAAIERKVVVFVLFGILLVSHQNVYPQEKSTTTEYALSCMDFMNYEEALVYLSQALGENPKGKGLRFYQAFAYFRMGNEEEAVKVLNEEIKKFPDSLYSRVLLSYIFYLQGKLNEAVQAGLDFDIQLNRALRVHGGYNEGPLKMKMKFYNLGLPYFIIGLRYKNTEKYNNAVRYFGYALRGEYNPVECYCQMIDTELVRKDWKRALSRIQQALDRAGAHPEFYFLMGYAHYQLGKVEDAASSFKEAIRLKPYFVEGTRNLALIHYNQEKYDDAAVLFTRTLKISPDDPISKIFLEKCLNEDPSGKNRERPRLTKDIADEVKLEYKYPIRGDIDTIANVINGWAMASVREGKLDEAKKLLIQFLDINDAPAQLYYNLGQIQNLFDEYENALRNACRAAELEKDFKGALDLIGNIYFKMEDYEHSLQAYKEAAKPGLADAMSFYNLGCAHHALGQFEEAEECFTNAIRFDRGAQKIEKSEKKGDDVLDVSVTVYREPASLKAHKSLGKLYLDQNDLKKALRHYESAYTFSPNDPELCYRIGKILYDQEEWAGALPYFEKHLFLSGQKEAEVKKLIHLIKEKRLPLMFRLTCR